MAHKYILQIPNTTFGLLLQDVISERIWVPQGIGLAWCFVFLRPNLIEMDNRKKIGNALKRSGLTMSIVSRVLILFVLACLFFACIFSGSASAIFGAILFAALFYFFFYQLRRFWKELKELKNENPSITPNSSNKGFLSTSALISISAAVVLLTGGVVTYKVLSDQAANEKAMQQTIAAQQQEIVANSQQVAAVIASSSDAQVAATAVATSSPQPEKSKVVARVQVNTNQKISPSISTEVVASSAISIAPTSTNVAPVIPTTTLPVSTNTPSPLGAHGQFFTITPMGATTDRIETLIDYIATITFSPAGNGYNLGKITMHFGGNALLGTTYYHIVIFDQDEQIVPAQVIPGTNEITFDLSNYDVSPGAKQTFYLALDDYETSALPNPAGSTFSAYIASENDVFQATNGTWPFSDISFPILINSLSFAPTN
jgi:hypothetical protein